MKAQAHIVPGVGGRNAGSRDLALQPADPARERAVMRLDALRIKVRGLSPGAAATAARTLGPALAQALAANSATGGAARPGGIIRLEPAAGADAIRAAIANHAALALQPHLPSRSSP